MGGLAGLLASGGTAVLDPAFARGWYRVGLETITLGAATGFLCGAAAFLAVVGIGKREEAGVSGWITAIGAWVAWILVSDGPRLQVALFAVVMGVAIRAGAGMGGERAVVGMVGILAVLSLSSHQLAARRIGGPPDVVLVTIDCLRADRMGSYGGARPLTPHLDRWSRRARVQEHAFATSGWTKPSIVSIWTGLYPTRHGINNPYDALSPELLTASKLLFDRRYRTMFINGGNPFISHSFGFQLPFASYRYEFHDEAERTVAVFLEALDEEPSPPVFAHLHLMDTHLPYPVSEFNQLYASTPQPLRPELQPDAITVDAVRKLTRAGALTQSDRTFVSDLYDGQIVRVDQQMGRLTRELARRGWHRFLGIVTSDHGEEFWDHDGFEHGHTLYEELVRIPLLVSGPDVPSGVSSSPASLVDLFPTVLDAAGSPHPETPGRSLLDEPGSDRALFMTGTLYGRDRFGVVRRQHKAILNTHDYGKRFPYVGAETRVDQELYDLTVDPAERRNRAPRDAAQDVELFDLIDSVRAERPSVTTEQPELSEETRRQLEALGYLE